MQRRITTTIVCVIILVSLAVTAFFLIDIIKRHFYPREYQEYVTQYAKEYDVPEPLIYAVIKTESDFDKDAESHAGAKGLMQLMPETYEWLARLNGDEQPTGEITDPETNIKYGVFYLSYLYKRFESWETALAAYNAGHGRVSGWLTDSRYSDNGTELKEIPIEETRNFVKKVTDSREEYQKLYYENGEQ